MSNYQQGYDEGRNDRRTAQAFGALVGGMFVLMVRGFVALLLASPFLGLAVLVLTPVEMLGPGFTKERLACIGVIAYLLYAGLYWLKGIVVGLRQRAGWLWVLPFALCVAFACLLPGLAVHAFLGKSASPLWAWGLGAAFAAFAYSRYRFTEDYAPAVALWSYRFGYRWVTK